MGIVHTHFRSETVGVAEQVLGSVEIRSLETIDARFLGVGLQLQTQYCGDHFFKPFALSILSKITSIRLACSSHLSRILSYLLVSSSYLS